MSPVAYAFVIATVSLIGLYVYETRRTSAGKSALIDFSLFKIATFGFGSFAGLIVSLGEFGILFSLPLFMQSVLGWSSLGAGGLLAVLALGAFFAAPTAAKIANARNPRFVARLGLVLEIVAILGISLFVSPSVSGWVLGVWLFIYGVGVGYATAQLTSLIMSDVPLQKSGQASGTQSTARQIGSAMGTAVLGTILFVSLHDNTFTQVEAVNNVSAGAVQLPAESVATVVEQSAGTVIPSLANPPGSKEIQDAASQAFADSLSSTGYVAAGFLMLGLLATLKLPEGRSYGRREEPEESALIHDFE
jgi:predicted MFS family arabinose efflux permease